MQVMNINLRPKKCSGQSRYGRYGSYATVIITPSNADAFQLTARTLARQLNSIVKSCQEFLTCLLTDISKTKYMIISRSHLIASALSCTPLEQVREHTDNGDLLESKIASLLLNSESLEEVAQLKYLGVTIT